MPKKSSSGPAGGTSAGRSPPMYCVRCKGRTPSQSPQGVVTSNGRRMIRAICAQCGGKKCMFVK